MPYKDPEVRKAYEKERYQRRKQYFQEMYQKNKDEILEKQKEYHQTQAGHKTLTIANWKRYGLIHDNMNTLYEQYLQATNCEVCKSVFKDTFDRKMDHDHTTGLFRQFLCASCNGFDNWLKR